jgi:hypothetical protein
MAKGESRWNPKERQVHKNEFRVAATNDYTLKSKKNFRVQCKDEEGAIPYVWGNVELLGTEDDQGRNISMLLPFYLTLTPKKEDGKPAVDLSGGLTELCQMLNVEVPEEVMNSVKTHAAVEDVRGEVEALSAMKVKEFLNSLGEFTVRAHVKKQPAKDPWPAKNQVQHFLVDEANKVG